MSKYLVTLSNAETDEFVTYAYGDFAGMRFAAKQGLAEIADKTGDFSIRIVPVEQVGVEPGEDVKPLVSITGDAESVTAVAKRKIASERKRLNPADESPADADAETV